MDMENLQVALPSSSTSDSAAPKYTFKRPYRQRFSLPYPIIKYMIQNPHSGKVWKKLIFSCKYFYSKYPVLPVKYLEVRNWGCKVDGEAFDTSKPFPKLWVYDSFSAFTDSDNSALITKVFKFDLRDLHLARQDLTFQDYQKLTSSGSVEELFFVQSTVKNADGTFVTADKLFENLTDLKVFDFIRPNPLMFQPDTIKKMVQHFDRFEDMRSFGLWKLEESFNFSSFVDFLMKNETVDICLSFPGLISVAYKEMVENVVKEIKKNPSLKVPVIKFSA